MVAGRRGLVRGLGTVTVLLWAIVVSPVPAEEVQTYRLTGLSKPAEIVVDRWGILSTTPCSSRGLATGSCRFSTAGARWRKMPSCAFGSSRRARPEGPRRRRYRTSRPSRTQTSPSTVTVVSTKKFQRT